MRSICTLLVLLCACSSPSSGESKEFIRRHRHEFVFTPPPSHPARRAPYPWEERMVGEHPRITEAFFRCKGSKHHASTDCNGHHGLPNDGIPEILIDLLNDIQEKTGQKVVITCGHRCPQHNDFAEPEATHSKHMVGAEVDFYVQNIDASKIIPLIVDDSFKRYTKPDTNVSTPPWYNEKIFVKYFKADEGRDFDNRHPYPYISIQIRSIPYSWPTAHRGYAKE